MTTSMPMLGADPGQLEALAMRLDRSTEQIASVRDRTNSTASNVVEALTGAFDGTVLEIQGAMSELQTDIAAAHVEMANTMWSGTNATNFNVGFSEFTAAMAALGDSVSGGYATDLKKRLLELTTDIHEFQGLASLALEQAGVSTESMRTAIHQQTEVLEQAMNGGMSFTGADGGRSISV